jgi:hypothetical protein
VQNHGLTVVPQPHGGALRPFAPGNRANPGGRPKDTAALAQRIRRETKQGRVLVDYLLDAVQHSRSSKERIDAATLLLAYGFGKPVQPVDFADADGKPAEVVFRVVYEDRVLDGGR